MRPSGRLLRAFKGWLDTRAVVRVAGIGEHRGRAGADADAEVVALGREGAGARREARVEAGELALALVGPERHDARVAATRERRAGRGEAARARLLALEEAADGARVRDDLVHLGFGRARDDAQELEVARDGRYWRLATPEQREAYLKAFNESIVYTYTNRFKDYSGQTLKVDGSREDGQFVIVTSRIIDPNGGPSVVLDWRVVRVGDDYKVVDLKIEDVSMSITLRREYTSLIENNGRTVQALIDALNKSMATLKAKSS